MKLKITIIFAVLATFLVNAQSTTQLEDHYKKFYQQMKVQGDAQGLINALTHLLVLNPNEATKDTLAYIYMDTGSHMQALNTIGIDVNENDSDIRLQIKALCLKAIKQPQRAIEQFEIMHKRNPNAYLAYELADLNVVVGNNDKALTYVNYGLTNSKEDMKHAFFETQQPYEVSLKAAFLHIRALIEYNNDKSNIDKAIATIDEALAIAPNFNLATLSKNALIQRKETPEEVKD